MDFSTIDLAKASDKGAECHLNDPVYGTPLYTEDGKKVTITVLGRDSKAFREALSMVSEREVTKNTPDTAEANAIDILVECITGWDNIIWNKEPLEFTEENVRMFLTKFPPIRQQLDAFLSKRANFFKSSKTK